MSAARTTAVGAILFGSGLGLALLAVLRLWLDGAALSPGLAILGILLIVGGLPAATKPWRSSAR